MALLRRYVSRRFTRYLYYTAIVGTVFFVTSLYYSGSEIGFSKKSENEPKKSDEISLISNDSPQKQVKIEAGESESESENSETLDKDGDFDKPENKKDGFDPFMQYRNLPKKDWHDVAAMERDKKRKGPGEQGTPVALPSDAQTKKKQDAIYRVNGFDGLASDLIAFNRSLKDIRHLNCQKKMYVSKLPTVTVVVPFHNEHWSTLLRTVHSVHARSPKSVLKQIILVDDFSTKEFLKQELDDYLSKTFKKDFVKVVRVDKREGLIRAREIGAKHVRSSVIVFLDSHSEANYNWLPPLVEPIALNYRTVVCPFVDVVDCDSLEYRAQDEGARGSFDWEFSYKRLPLLADDKLDPTEPFKSPVMAGGYFAISTKWFWELGGYDEGLDIWGGEQYELSFKIWQCHGQMLDAPCSRVGHIYRCKGYMRLHASFLSTLWLALRWLSSILVYCFRWLFTFRHVPFPNPGVGDFISRNYKRVAEVWMDEFKQNLYKRRPGTRDADAGDISKQMEVRQRLQCKPFKWFMETVMFDQEKFYPAVEPPDGAFGEIRNEAALKCIDTQFKGKDERFELRKCLSDDQSSGGEQMMRFAWWRDIRASKRSMCFDVSTSVDHAPIVLFPCHGMQGNQEWRYKLESRQLYHKVSNLCMDCDAERGELFMSSCNVHSKTQRWTWATYNETIVGSWK